MISFNRPTIKRNDMDSVLTTMVDEQIGCGERSAAFNQSFATCVGSDKSYMFRTYYDCIRSALKICGATESSKVAVSVLSPKVYKEVLDEIGCNTILVDVDKENGLPDEKQVCAFMADILILYEPCSSLPLKYNTETTFAEKMDYCGVKLIEDVSTSIGSSYGEEFKAGNFGDVVICSFEDSDIVSCGGGAGLAFKANDPRLVDNVEINQYTSRTDLNASLGSVQLDNLADNSKKRRDISKIFCQELSKTPHKQFGFNAVDFNGAASSFSVLLKNKPDETIKFAAKHGVPVEMTFKSSICSMVEGDLFEAFPVAAGFYFRTVSFPLYPFLKASEIDIISKVIAHLP